ncbi:hypothetical protein [Caballeronia sp. BCC1704]|uniref:hypothetical protein n=1 Tax=Caballeronia sp. BCC1704 TaxID=2676300 RepID=UPI00158CB5BE|nr:hypothetical protein [Caballeronia sp. BCC1704]
MFVRVVQMRFHGKALEQSQIRTAEPVRADLLVSHESSSELGRYADVARLRAGDGAQAELLPALYDCRLSHMGTNGFVLSGVELAGSIAFAQAWWCRPAA